MAQRDASSAATFEAGFEFARMARNPEFRSLLKRLGWEPGRHTVMALDHEPVVDVVARVMFHETGGRAIIAIPDSSEPHGFRLVRMEVVRVGEPLENLVPLGPGASIGMLCELLRPIGTYVPSDLSHAMRFERVLSGGQFG